MMRDADPIFVFTIARSGGTLLAHMLSAHPQIAFASDPAMPMLKAIRDAAWRANLPADLAAAHCAAPFQNGFATRSGQRLLRALLDADLAGLRGGVAWPAFIDQSRARAAHMCPDLVHVFDDLEPHGTWLRHLGRLLDAIRAQRGGAATTHAGFKEVWSIALWPMLARALPNSRAIILLRDPRAVLASMLALAEKAPSQRGHCVSYVWHWKHLAAFALANEPWTHSDRLLVIRYEDLVTAPGTATERLCAFLDVPAEAAMLAAALRDPGTGAAWAGNSSFERHLAGVSPRSLERWKDDDVLPPGIVEMAERLAGPDMQATAYEPATMSDDSAAWDEAFAHEAAATWSWSAGLIDADAAAAWCEARDAWLAGDRRKHDGLDVEACFLFESTLERIRATSGAPAMSGGAD